MSRQFIIALAFLFFCKLALAEELSAPPVSDWNTPVGAPCAQPKSADAPLNLLDVVDQALCHYPQTRETWANAKAAAAQVGVNRADYLPNINLSASASHQNVRGAGVNSNSSTQSLGLSVDYLLFDFGGREARVESAKQALISADWTHDATLQNVIFTAVQNYYQLFAARATVEAQIENEKSALQNLEAAKSRYEAGVATSADKLQAQTAYSQAQLTRMRAEGDAQIAQGNLANIMGLDADISVNIVAPVAQPSDEQQQNIRSLMETAKRERPDLAAAEAQVNAAEANVRAARANGLPTLSLGANQNFNHSNVSDQPRTTSIGLSLNVPLFTGFRNTYQIKQAQAQAEARVAQRDRIGNQVSLDVWKAYHNLNTEQQAFKTAVDLMESARESLRVALGRYKAGVGTLIDLLTAQAAMANANSQYIQAAYTWYIAKAALAQAIGSLHVQNLESVIPNISEKPVQK
jgi:TolC family type I secretion outer membrane protein